jgi:lipoprotein-releasing system permease protein
MNTMHRWRSYIMEDAERIIPLSGPTGLRLRVDDMQRAPEVAADLSVR